MSLESLAHGYVLDVDPESVDLHRFRRLRSDAAAAAAVGNGEVAAALFREADALWRGEPFTGLPGDWLARMRDSLLEERLAAIKERIGLALRLGRHAEVVGELHGLAAQHPLDEAFAALFMTALYLSGRPGNALEAYRQIRRRLVAELGTEPGPELAGLHQRILSRDPGLAAGVSSGTPRPRPDTLPPAVQAFVGRVEEIRLLMARSGSSPLIAVIEGMPGVGKTALAIHVAREAGARCPDGSLYLNLAAHDLGRKPLDPAEGLDRLLRMISVSPERIPRSLAERSALWRAELTRRHAVVILDDAADLDQIQPLLPAGGDCLVLVTTRRRLADFQGASRLVLDVLPLTDAIALLSQAAGPNLADDQDALAQVARLCGCLPLAIQLTAAVLRQDKPPALTKLAEDLARAASGHRGIGVTMPRVVAAFEVSYRCLAPDQQRLFRFLAISPCTQMSVSAAAAALGSVTPESADALVTVLLDQHLLGGSIARRFWFHDLVRQFAIARAEAEDSPLNRRQAVGRLLDYYLYTADRADRVLYPHRERRKVAAHPPMVETPIVTADQASQWLAEEWRSILQAARHASEHEWLRECADLTHAIGGYLDTQAYWDEAVAAHSLALQACRDLFDHPRSALVLLELCLVNQRIGRYDTMLTYAAESLVIYQSLADRHGEAAALDRLGVAFFYSNKSREALAHFNEARSLYEADGDQHGVAITLRHSGVTYGDLGRYWTAAACFEEELGINRTLADRRGEAKALNNLGDILLYQGKHRDALERYNQAVAIFQEIGGRWDLAILHSNIGNIYQREGDYDKALTDYQFALVTYRSVGDVRHQAGSLCDIGSVYRVQGLHGEAISHYRQALSLADQIDASQIRVKAWLGLADAQRDADLLRQALESYQAALGLARGRGNLYDEARILREMAEVIANVRGPGEARVILRQALDIFEQLRAAEAEIVRRRIDDLGPPEADGLRHDSEPGTALPSDPDENRETS